MMEKVEVVRNMMKSDPPSAGRLRGTPPPPIPAPSRPSSPPPRFHHFHPRPLCACVDRRPAAAGVRPSDRNRSRGASGSGRAEICGLAPRGGWGLPRLLSSCFPHSAPFQRNGVLSRSVPRLCGKVWEKTSGEREERGPREQRLEYEPQRRDPPDHPQHPEGPEQPAGPNPSLRPRPSPPAPAGHRAFLAQPDDRPRPSLVLATHRPSPIIPPAPHFSAALAHACAPTFRSTLAPLPPFPPPNLLSPSSRAHAAPTRAPEGAEVLGGDQVRDRRLAAPARRR